MQYQKDYPCLKTRALASLEGRGPRSDLGDAAKEARFNDLFQSSSSDCWTAVAR